ncbi:unnamed protein product [Chilo suppressalis]|uniref:CCHC-type domain-containing protein n=1 Tax=Chilo suppressalis TaxID=168631 RepID=A0ABN8B995_CHISP|nr:unnamed protein product [Chilo suppressalis]
MAPGDITETLKTGINVVKLGVGVNRLRNLRGNRVLVGCSTSEERDRLGEAKAGAGLGLSAAVVPRRRPLLRLLGVARDTSDAQVLEAVREQNAGLLGPVPLDEKAVRVVRRIKSRMGPHSSVVLEVDPSIWAALKNRRVRVAYQMVPAVDQSPVTQCYRCQGFGHLASSCRAETPSCGYCGDLHDTRECPNRGLPPKCANCAAPEDGEPSHPAYSTECSAWRKADRQARLTVAYQ